MFAAFVGEHRGFLLKELVSHGMSLETLEGTIRSGGLFLSPVSGRYVDSLNRPLQEILAEPHLVGLTRELAVVRFGTWIGSLFVYRPPQFGFRPASSACCSLRCAAGQTRILPPRLRSPFPQ